MTILIGTLLLGLMVAVIVAHVDGMLASAARVGASRRRVRPVPLTLGLCGLPLVLTACTIHVGNGH